MNRREVLLGTLSAAAAASLSISIKPETIVFDIETLPGMVVIRDVSEATATRLISIGEFSRSYLKFAMLDDDDALPAD